MAHELGHGLHAALAQPQGVFHQSTPLTLAETASVFGEGLVFGRMLAEVTDDERRLGLLAERVDGAIATVFRQMAMNRFEHLVHTRRRAEGELSVDRIDEHVGRDAGGAVRRLGRDHRRLPDVVVHVPHFINTPGYVYAYASGYCSRCRSTAATSTRASRSSRATSSCCRPAGRAAPSSWREIVGIDLADPGFWDSGLALVEEQLSEAEALAAGR